MRVRYSLAASLVPLLFGAACATTTDPVADEIATAGTGGAGGSGSEGPLVQGGAAGEGAASGSEECARDRHVGVIRGASVLLLVDASDSMNRDDKWAKTQVALEATLADAPTQLDAGLVFFPAGVPGLSSVCLDVMTSPVVGISPVASSRGFISSAMMEMSPTGGTPTYPALREAYRMLGEQETAGVGYVLLITDGDPTLAEVANIPDDTGTPVPTTVWEGCGVMEDIEALVSDAASATPPIKTIVVGSPGVKNHDAMSMLGKLGGMPRDAACSTDAGCELSNECCHYIPDGGDFEQGLSDALEEIRGRVIGCTFELPGGDHVDRNTVNVEIDETGNTAALLRDPSRASGWDYSDDTQSAITLHGDSCQRVKTSPDAEVVIVVGCPTEVVK